MEFSTWLYDCQAYAKQLVFCRLKLGTSLLDGVKFEKYCFFKYLNGNDIPMFS